MNLFHRIREWVLSPPGPPGVGSGAQGERGQFGEDRAAAFARAELGLKVVARNWRSPRDKRDEIDLICQDGEVLVFVEVRLRSSRALVPAYYSVDTKKKRILLRACKDYLSRLPKPPKHFRFDVIALALSAHGDYELKHYANVPLFPKHYTAER